MESYKITGKRKLFILSVEHFSKSEIANRPSALLDAESLITVFTEKLKFECDERFRLIGKVTQNELVRGIRDFERECADLDMVALVFMTHGTFDPNFGQNIVLSDGTQPILSINRLFQFKNVIKCWIKTICCLVFIRQKIYSEYRNCSLHRFVAETSTHL